MSWSTPKTDWNGETVDGVYTGDRFNSMVATKGTFF